MAEVVQWPLGTVNVRVRWSEALAVPEAHVMCVVRTIAAIASDDHLRASLVKTLTVQIGKSEIRSASPLVERVFT